MSGVEHTETIVRLITALSDLGISKEYLKRKYLSIDWEQLKKFETEEKLEEKVSGKNDEEEAGGIGNY